MSESVKEEIEKFKNINKNDIKANEPWLWEILRALKNSIGWHPFADKIFRYRKIIDKDQYFKTIVERIKNNLNEQQLRRIEITNKNQAYDLWNQIFLRYVDNRYLVHECELKALDNVDRFIAKYEFMLESQLDSLKVRNIFMQSLMDCISIGSGLFYAVEDFHLVELPVSSINYHEFEHPKPRPSLFRLWKTFRKDFFEVCELIGNRYPKIPEIKIPWPNSGLLESCTLETQLLISYSYAFRKLFKNKKIDSEEFGEEFIRRCGWWLESLTKCDPIFVNKYKERVFKELSSALGMDVDRSYFVNFSFLNDPGEDQYKQKYDLSEFTVNLFSEEQLKLFELSKSDGSTWDFREQFRDRYYSKYLSFVSIQEIENNIRKKVEEYRPLLNENTVEVVRDSMFDEIERECFVSRKTYLWNQEMEQNLKKPSLECPKKIIKAIDLLISMIPETSVEQFSIDLGGRVFSLKEQLICRWKRAWLGCSLKDFQEYLSQMHILTPYSFERWKEKVSRTDLQAFLEEIDMFFLYPWKWRFIRKIMSRLDNGRVVGKANTKRLKIAKCGDVYVLLKWHRWRMMVSRVALPNSLFTMVFCFIFR